MANTDVTVDLGLKLVARHPAQCARLLANNLYPLLNEASWFTKEWRLKFCAYFLQNLADQSIEEEVDKVLLRRVRKVSMSQAIRLIERNSPEAGLKVLVALICQELRCRQNLDVATQHLFYNELFGRFFPD